MLRVLEKRGAGTLPSSMREVGWEEQARSVAPCIHQTHKRNTISAPCRCGATAPLHAFAGKVQHGKCLRPALQVACRRP